MAEGVQSGPERSRARSVRRSEPLTARTDLSPFRQEAKGAVVLFFSICSQFFALRPNPHCRHPSIRTLSERFVSLGASWVFSFQPVLPPVSRPLFPSRDGSWARPLTQSPKLGIWARCFQLVNQNYAAAGNISRRLLRSGS